MALALEQARKAASIGEVPVGAVVVNRSSGEVVAQAHNLKESPHDDPCGHAEILALQAAASRLKTWRLSGCSVYVTLEPCMMCCGALIHARVDEVIFGAMDPKSGFVTSLSKGFEDFDLNHRPQWRGGVLQEEASLLLKDFFRERRKK